ncbi:cactin [Carex littledalei]|uniref:Splicing factor Cactin n=1 Tax=Carex littledalei TaxID=544730 RepID=A0A833QCK1_9POAL|nr:cactin [Carex littledalei]
MGRHKESSSRKKRRRTPSPTSSSDESPQTDSNSNSDSDSDSARRRRRSRPSKGRHDRSRSRRRRSRRDDSESASERSSGESSDSGSDKRSKGRKKREITEEEILDYKAKKAQKEALKVAKKLKSSSVSGYCNESNPFGDPNLTESFVWRKKIEREVVQGHDPEISVKAERKRQKERMAEIEKVKKRREERAIERAQREEELALLARERAKAEFQDWEKKEEEFHFDQSKVRSKIRLQEGRTKPIDVLLKNLNFAEEFDIELDEPYTVFKGLTVKEMEELREDIKMHLDLDTDSPINVEYWEALIVICDWELLEAQKRDALDRARVRGEEPPPEVVAEERGLHSTIESDVRELLEGKSSVELEKMQHQIESQMRSGNAKVVEYWEAVLKRLHIYKAKARLREIHASLLRKYLQQLEQGTVVEKEGPLPMKEIEPDEEDMAHDIEDAREHSLEPIVEEREQTDEEEAGSFSPVLMHGSGDEEAIDPEEDMAELERKREAVVAEHQRRIKEAMTAKKASAPDDLELKAMKAMGAMEEGDAVFGSGAEVHLDSQVYWWHDKYRPRKPKYFNRVHTGYEWNKYNQTHYDHDNPPPKIVQGYKFNVFYPDLVDKTKAPTYTIEKDGSTGETCLIRFHAGPPYEDICFRIVNKEWEYSHKKGFKCTFERGILHLYFNFKRYRYRR